MVSITVNYKDQGNLLPQLTKAQCLLYQKLKNMQISILPVESFRVNFNNCILLTEPSIISVVIVRVLLL